MDKLWVRIAVAIGFLTLVGVIALLADHVIQMPKGVVALTVFAAGVLSIIATKRALAPLSEVTQVLEGIADGDLDQRRVPVLRNDEIGRLGTSTNRMLSQLNALSERAKKLADGRIDVLEVEEQVLRTERLSDADLKISPKDGDLERSFIAMTNQLRRLTIQARMISKDQFFSPLLDQSVPGELGEAFATMVGGLRNVTSHAKLVADGDLTARVPGQGDLTDSFNQMIDSLQGLVEEITHTAIRISTAAEEILAVLREQEMSANHQASSVEETQRTMETLLSSAKKIAENAQHVFKSAEKTQGNNRTVAERIGELKNHTERISEILGGIKRIADRSDLLALNASLEGMRAGEAGKGFTLVAAEMRRLAENIKDSVGDIKELVEDIGESSMASAMATDEGTRLSENTTDNALKITLITQQQKSGTEQVTQSMDDLSELITQGVAGTQQVTMAASELADLADSLRGLVDRFRISDAPSTSAEFAAVNQRSKVRNNTRHRRPSANLRAAKPAKRPAAATPVERSERETTKLSPIDTPAEPLPEVAGETRLVEESSIPIDSGADQPTIEFATNMSEDDQRDVMHKMLAERRSAEANNADSVDTNDLELDDDLDADNLADEASSVDEQIDALERELEKAEEGLAATSEGEKEA